VLDRLGVLKVERVAALQVRQHVVDLVRLLDVGGGAAAHLREAHQRVAGRLVRRRAGDLAAPLSFSGSAVAANAARCARDSRCTLCGYSITDWWRTSFTTPSVNVCT
jgi:hypothetical protein